VVRELSESDLVNKIISGNTEAFNEFVRRYEKPVSAIIIGMLGKTPEAEEIAQDVFIKFYLTADKFRKESGVKTYLTRMAINHSINELNRQKRYRKKYTGDDVSRMEKFADPLNHSERYDLKELVDNALLQLDPKSRLVIILRLIEGYTTEEAAKILSIPKGTVLSRLFRAQEQLRVILKGKI
jgi:RNA polymerase sigma-70 factor (ECF subfamily)